MHRHIALDIDAIIDNFSRADTRRNEECMFLMLFPLTIDIVNILKRCLLYIAHISCKYLCKTWTLVIILAEARAVIGVNNYRNTM